MQRVRSHRLVDPSRRDGTHHACLEHPMGKKTRLREQHRLAAEYSVYATSQAIRQAAAPRRADRSRLSPISPMSSAVTSSASRLNALRRPQDWRPRGQEPLEREALSSTSCASRSRATASRRTWKPSWLGGAQLRSLRRHRGDAAGALGVRVVRPARLVRHRRRRAARCTVRQTRDIPVEGRDAPLPHCAAARSRRRAGRCGTRIARAQGESNVGALGDRADRRSSNSRSPRRSGRRSRVSSRATRCRAHAIDDLIDYPGRRPRREDEDVLAQGPHAGDAARRMEVWHRALRKQQVGRRAARGKACALPDIAYEAGNEEHRAIWRFRQIKTGNELFREGQAMHHCVVTYKSACMAGRASIWSLTSRIPDRQAQSRRDHRGRAATAASCRCAASPTGVPMPTRSRWSSAGPTITAWCTALMLS